MLLSDCRNRFGRGAHIQTDAASTVRAEQLHIRQACRKDVGERSGMDRVHVIGLGKCIVGDLPIAVEISVIFVAIVHFGIGIAAHMGAVVAEDGLLD